VDIGFNEVGSVEEVLELVAKEAGLEGALKLAEIFQIELPDDFPDRVLLPPRANRSTNS
jgi:hypothetical protein